MCIADFRDTLNARCLEILRLHANERRGFAASRRMRLAAKWRVERQHMMEDDAQRQRSEHVPAQEASRAEWDDARQISGHRHLASTLDQLPRDLGARVAD